MKYTVEVTGNYTMWFKEGTSIRHREDGPAIDYVNGVKAWYKDDVRHREDGPAVEWDDGTKLWYLNGVQLTEKEFLEKIKPSCYGKVVEIDGKKYKLVSL